MPTSGADVTRRGDLGVRHTTVLYVTRAGSPVCRKRVGDSVGVFSVSVFVQAATVCSLDDRNDIAVGTISILTLNEPERFRLAKTCVGRLA